MKMTKASAEVSNVLMVLLSCLHSAARTFPDLFVYKGSCKVRVIHILWENTTAFLILKYAYVKRSKFFISLLRSGTGFRLNVWSFETPSTTHGYSKEQRYSRAWSNLSLGWVENRKQLMNEWKIDPVFVPSAFNVFAWFSHLWWSNFSGLMRHSGFQLWM